MNVKMNVKRNVNRMIFSVLLVLALTMAAWGAADATSPPAQPEFALRAIPKTTITVDSGRDIDTSLSKTCVSDSPCTLRRAIVQARNIPDSERPVLIAFDIPATAQEGYDAALNIWKIEILSTSDLSVFRRLNGQIIIDGSTQTGGRTAGPKIFLVGPGTGSKDGLIVGDVAGDDAHEIRGLGFQNFKTHMYINTDSNLIEDNWFGLSDDGTEPFLRDDEPENGSGNAAISLASGSETNLIQNNVFLGLAGVAAAIRGDGNGFENNFIGTNGDGLVTGKQTDPSLVCTPVDWLGGGGISIDGQNHMIKNNIFAGLRLEVSIWSLQADTIRVGGGEGHSIEGNSIGVDAGDNRVGVCGRGIYLSDSPENLQVSDNEIAEPGLSAISLNGILYNANTLRRNTIRKTAAWPEIEGNPKPEDAIQLGTSLPDAFENFQPAQVTQINGTQVSGTYGSGSPCPNCEIEIFLDDTDGVVEALRSLAVVTADSNGNWSATLPNALTKNQGLRTTSTTAVYNTIPNMHAGTTTGLSTLYKAGIQRYIPVLLR